MRHVIDYIRNNKALLVVIVPAFFLHMLVIMPSGSHYCFNGNCGLFFWGAHGHDAVWHLAVIAVSFSHFPFIAPTFAGATLSGYNYLLDLVIFLVSKIGFPPLFLYFKLLPILWFISFTTLAIILARKIKDSPLYVGLLLFFFFFGGSFSYFLTLYHHQTIWNSSALLSMQAGLTLVNLQFAFSLVFLLAILILIKDKKINFKKVLLLSALVFINLGLKFYGGVISLLLIIVYLILQKGEFKKTLGYIAITLGIAAVAVLLFYNPFSSLQTGTVLSFSPLSTVHPIIEEPELVYMKNEVNARYFMQAKGGLSLRLIRTELVTLLIFLVFNFGTRFLGFLYVPWQIIKKRFSQFDLIVLVGVVAATLMTILFVQKGQWWNTVQFLYYGLFLSNFFIARLLYDLFTAKKAATFLLASLILILTVPINIDLIRIFTTVPAQSYVSDNELKALNFLKKQHQDSGAVYFASLKKVDHPEDLSPRSLYTFADTAYVAAYSGKPEYFDDVVQLQLTGVDYSWREKLLKKEDCQIFKQVSYIYDMKAKKDTFLQTCIKNGLEVKKIFENQEVRIYSLVSRL